MPFTIIRNDITKVEADAVVNTANPKPIYGSGTDRAIYRAAGEEQLLRARKKIGEIKPGEARETEAFGLRADYIIHTVGPSWSGGQFGERDVLRSCYENTLKLADQLKCRSIAFPLISTGAYGFPKSEALNIALSEIGKFLLIHDMEIILVVFDKDSLILSESMIGEIDRFIDDSSVDALRKSEYDRRRLDDIRRYRSGAETSQNLSGTSDAFIAALDLEDYISRAGMSFRDKLFELIDRSGMTDVEVYKKANIDRKVFSSIKCKKDYKPKKTTAVAFAIALELDIHQLYDLLSRAGFTLDPSNRFDRIIEYYVRKRNYNIYEINCALFDHDLPLLR